MLQRFSSDHNVYFSETTLPAILMNSDQPKEKDYARIRLRHYFLEALYKISAYLRNMDIISFKFFTYNRT